MRSASDLRGVRLNSTHAQPLMAESASAESLSGVSLSPTTLRARRFPTQFRRTTSSSLLFGADSATHTHVMVPVGSGGGVNHAYRSTDSFADVSSTGSLAMLFSPVGGGPRSPQFPPVDPNTVTVFYPPQHWPEGAESGAALEYGAPNAASARDANADLCQVRVEGYFDRDVSALVQSDLPRSTLLYVMTASDGRDLMFKLIQYSLQLAMCVLKAPSLVSVEARAFVDPWADQFFRNYNTIRHGRSLFKVGRGILNLFTLQSVVERLWWHYDAAILEMLAPLLALRHSVEANVDFLASRTPTSSPTTSTATARQTSEADTPTLPPGRLQRWLRQLLPGGAASCDRLDRSRNGHPVRQHDADTLITDDLYSNVSRVERGIGIRVSPTQRGPSRTLEVAAVSPTVRSEPSGSPSLTPLAAPNGSATAAPLYVRGSPSAAPFRPSWPAAAVGEGGREADAAGFATTRRSSVNASLCMTSPQPPAVGAVVQVIAAPVVTPGAAGTEATTTNAVVTANTSNKEDVFARSSWSAASPMLATVPPTPEHQSLEENQQCPNDGFLSKLGSMGTFETGSYGAAGLSLNDENGPPLRSGTLPLTHGGHVGNSGVGTNPSSRVITAPLLLQPLQTTEPPAPCAGGSFVDAIAAAAPPTSITTSCAAADGTRSYFTPTERVPSAAKLSLDDEPRGQQRHGDCSPSATPAAATEGSQPDAVEVSSAAGGEEKKHYNDSEFSLESHPASDCGILDRSIDLITEPASAAAPARWRKPPTQFNPVLMVLIGVRNLAAACRRFMRDLTMISSERFIAFDYVENNRERLHRRINHLWLVVSVIDLLLNTIRLAQTGWFRYAMARQSLRSTCGCAAHEDPQDVMRKNNNTMITRKGNLFFPKLDLDYGAPYASNVTFLEAANPMHMMPACSRCDCLYADRISERPTAAAAVGFASPAMHGPKHPSIEREEYPTLRYPTAQRHGARPASGESPARTLAPPPPLEESSASLLFLPRILWKAFNYAWLIRAHPNLTSTLLLEARYIAELFLAYKYCFGGYEPNCRDAPMAQVLKPYGAVAGMVSAAVGLLRVVESAPS